MWKAQRKNEKHRENIKIVGTKQHNQNITEKEEEKGLKRRITLKYHLNTFEIIETIYSTLKYIAFRQNAI
jgi:hypothetical protein